MGIVYEAVHTELQRNVALKMLKAVLHTEPDKLARFRKEAQVIASLSHPNIVSVYAVGVSDSCIPYIAMELLPGTTLANLIKEQGPLPYRNAISLFIKICDAVSHAHQNGIIHRDLKPSNFMVEKTSDEWRVKVVDFGIAKILSAEQELTKTTAVVGSVFYMSPGQCEGRSADTRSDIYAIGCSLFEALTGRPPFNPDTYVEIVASHRTAAPPTVRSVVPEAAVPEGLELIIRCCLEKDEQFRYARIENLQQDLQSVLDGQQPQHIPYKPAAAKREISTRGRAGTPRRLIIIGASVCALAAFATALSLTHHKDEASDPYATLTTEDVRRKVFEVNTTAMGLTRQHRYEDAEKELLQAQVLKRYIGDEPYFLAMLDGRSALVHFAKGQDEHAYDRTQRIQFLKQSIDEFRNVVVLYDKAEALFEKKSQDKSRVVSMPAAPHTIFNNAGVTQTTLAVIRRQQLEAAYSAAVAAEILRDPKLRIETAQEAVSICESNPDAVERISTSLKCFEVLLRAQLDQKDFDGAFDTVKREYEFLHDAAPDFRLKRINDQAQNIGKYDPATSSRIQQFIRSIPKDSK